MHKGHSEEKKEIYIAAQRDFLLRISHDQIIMMSLTGVKNSFGTDVRRRNSEKDTLCEGTAEEP